MKIISVINQKGGVGKSTISSNLAYSLALTNQKVLLIDLDPQGHSCEIYKGKQKIKNTIKDLFINNDLHISETITSAVANEKPINNLDIIHSNIYFAKVSEQVTFRAHRERILYNHLKRLSKYNYIILDCPPNLGVVTTNAIFASNSIIIPVTYDKGALDGTADLMQTIGEIKENNDFSYFILRNAFDSRNKQTNHYIETELSVFGDKILDTKIRRTEAINQARIAQLPVFLYDPICNATKDYADLAKEVLENV